MCCECGEYSKHGEYGLEPHHLVDRVGQILERDVEQALLLPERVAGASAPLDQDLAICGIELEGGLGGGAEDELNAQ